MIWIKPLRFSVAVDDGMVVIGFEVAFVGMVDLVLIALKLDSSFGY